MSAIVHASRMSPPSPTRLILAGSNSGASSRGRPDRWAHSAPRWAQRKRARTRVQRKRVRRWAQRKRARTRVQRKRVRRWAQRKRARSGCSGSGCGGGRSGSGRVSARIARARVLPARTGDEGGRRQRDRQVRKPHRDHHASLHASVSPAEAATHGTAPPTPATRQRARTPRVLVFADSRLMSIISRRRARRSIRGPAPGA